MEALSIKLPKTLQILRLAALRHGGRWRVETTFELVDHLVRGVKENLPCLRKIDVVESMGFTGPEMKHFQGEHEVEVTVETVRELEGGYEWWDDAESCF